MTVWKVSATEDRIAAPRRGGKEKPGARIAPRARFAIWERLLVVLLLALLRERLVELLLLLVVLADFLQLVEAFGPDRPELGERRLLVLGVLDLVGRFLHLRG